MTEQKKKAYTLGEIAALLGGTVQGDANITIEGLNTLEKAKPSELSFLANPKYASQLSSSHAGAVLVREDQASSVSGAALVIDHPYRAFAKATHLFDWRASVTGHISPSASIAPTAVIAADASIAAGVVIGDHVEIKSGVSIGANSVIERDCIIGERTRLEANVTLYPNVHLGQRCLIHSGAVIGSDGFGFAPSSDGWIKICQLGGVRIGDDVEVGASTTIDRGALDNTVIEDGVKLDNQIQIAHNVVIGAQTAIAGCTAVAGSTKIGRHCTIAGQCGITGHLTIADHTHITAMSLISKSITEPGGAFSSGTGQESHQTWKRNVVRFRQLDEMARRVKRLEQQIDDISTKGFDE
jgi:UDP-3-O-[3-hydroxymyristoyl] glucosamine N-acyltransferase